MLIDNFDQLDEFTLLLLGNSMCKTMGYAASPVLTLGLIVLAFRDQSDSLRVYSTPFAKL